MHNLFAYQPREDLPLAWLLRGSNGNFEGAISVKKRYDGAQFFEFGHYKDGHKYPLEDVTGEPEQHLGLLGLCVSIVTGKAQIESAAAKSKPAMIDLSTFDGFIKESSHEFSTSKQDDDLNAIFAPVSEGAGGF